MSEKVTVTLTCDICHNEIDKDSDYVNANVYGRDMHISCVMSISGATLIILLDLDDIKIMEYDNWEQSRKAPTYFRIRADNEYGKTL